MPGKILVIDDEASLRHTLTRLLHSAGFEVTTAQNGQEGLRFLAESSFDLVYLDIHLPDLDGIQVFKRIRQKELYLPVILFTAHGSLPSAVEALRLGATDYLLKPLDPEVFLARTRVVLQESTLENRKRALRSQITALHAELHQLEAEALPASPSPLLSPIPSDRFLKRGRLVLDLQARRATFGEAVLSLPPTTFDYLVILARHAPEVVPYQTLVAEAQGYQAALHEARELAKWHIHILRQALEPDPQQPEQVINVRGSGYRLLVN
jgi:DNA-binding response OmpR family regulator